MERIHVRGPIRSKERYVLMDGLRGLALFGILLVNLRIMAAPSMAYGEFSVWSGALAKGAELISCFFFDGAFWTLFAMLFGAGFTVMMGEVGRQSAIADSVPLHLGIGLWAYYRRLFLIGVFGLLHVLLLWHGDILMIYALAGMVLPLFRKCRTRTLIIWSVSLIVVPQVIYLFFLSVLQLLGPEEIAGIVSDYSEETQEWVGYLVEGYRNSDFVPVFWARLEEFGYNVWYAFSLVPSALGMMLLGIVLARSDRFSLDPLHGPFFRKLLLVAIIPAMVGKAAYAYGFLTVDLSNFGTSAAFIVGHSAGGLASAFVLFCGLRALYRSRVALWLQRGLAAAGRMALTLYLMQSLIGGWIFYGYGLGLYGKVPPHGLWVIALMIFVGEVVFARFWFKRYRQGPLEFVLRKFTYLAPLPSNEH